MTKFSSQASLSPIIPLTALSFIFTQTAFHLASHYLSLYDCFIHIIYLSQFEPQYYLSFSTPIRLSLSSEYYACHPPHSVTNPIYSSTFSHTPHHPPHTHRWVLIRLPFAVFHPHVSTGLQSHSSTFYYIYPSIRLSPFIMLLHPSPIHYFSLFHKLLQNLPTYTPGFSILIHFYVSHIYSVYPDKSSSRFLFLASQTPITLNPFSQTWVTM